MSKQVKAKKKRLTFGQFLANNSVPIMFIIFCAICIPISGFSPSYLLNEIVTRMGRNTFLILCLLIPIMAGMGLNFGMTLGAMAGEIALIFVSDWQIWGIPGVVLAMILSIPISILLGAFCGSMLNRARGREMITSYIISFFINGVYQLVVLYMMGSIIPIQHSEIKLPRGYGIRNTVSLLNMRQCIDNLLAINVNGVKIPVLTFILIVRNGDLPVSALHANMLHDLITHVSSGFFFCHSAFFRHLSYINALAVKFKSHFFCQISHKFLIAICRLSTQTMIDMHHKQRKVIFFFTSVQYIQQTYRIFSSGHPYDMRSS